jgi:hypothetical protein
MIDRRVHTPRLLWVKGRRTHGEHNEAACPQEADTIAGPWEGPSRATFGQSAGPDLLSMTRGFSAKELFGLWLLLKSSFSDSRFCRLHYVQKISVPNDLVTKQTVSKHITEISHILQIGFQYCAQLLSPAANMPRPAVLPGCLDRSFRLRWPPRSCRQL